MLDALERCIGRIPGCVHADGSGRSPVGAVTEGVPGGHRVYRATAGSLYRPAEQRPALAGPEAGAVACQPHGSLPCNQSSPGVQSRLGALRAL